MQRRGGTRFHPVLQLNYGTNGGVTFATVWVSGVLAADVVAVVRLAVLVDVVAIAARIAIILPAVDRGAEAAGGLGGGGAAVVLVSSVAGGGASLKSGVPYALTKAALDQLARNLACEWAGAGIRVNAVNAGTTDTGIHARAGRPNRAAEVGARTPIGRAAAPDEIAATVEWLTTHEARYVTGAVMDVAGGL